MMSISTVGNSFWKRVKMKESKIQMQQEEEEKENGRCSVKHNYE
jgi:hypothetical protein